MAKMRKPTRNRKPGVVIASIMVSLRLCGGGRAYAFAAASRRRPVQKAMRQVMIVLGGCLAPARIDGFDDDAVERRRAWKHSISRAESLQ
jgi:hypothetical protein